LKLEWRLSGPVIRNPTTLKLRGVRLPEERPPLARLLEPDQMRSK